MSNNPVLNIGHRGARGVYPENTVNGFIEAVKLGAHGIEFDVVISKDRQVIVSHEPWMNPLFCHTPGGRQVDAGSERKYNFFEMDYAAIRQFDCGINGHPDFLQQQKVSEYKPLLSEMISAVEAYITYHQLPGLIYNVEIKTEPDELFQPSPAEFVRLVLAELKKHQLNDRAYISSFDKRILKEVKKAAPEIRLGLLTEDVPDFQKSIIELGFQPEIFSPYFAHVDEQLVKNLQTSGTRLITWTVNETSDMMRLIDLGVDGIITDFPGRLADLLGSDGPKRLLP